MSPKVTVPLVIKLVPVPLEIVPPFLKVISPAFAVSVKFPIVTASSKVVVAACVILKLALVIVLSNSVSFALVIYRAETFTASSKLASLVFTIVSFFSPVRVFVKLRSPVSDVRAVSERRVTTPS